MTVLEDFAYGIPDVFSDLEAAPLLCAGAIGYRSLRLTGLKDGQNLGFTGFGASAHILLKTVKHQYPNSKVFVFARSEEERMFAKELGAVWTGGIKD
jgi:propanol-preferring alcohol dehydrogenase